MEKDVYNVEVAVTPADGSGEKTQSARFALYPDPSVLTGFRLDVKERKSERDGVSVVDGSSAQLTWSVDSGEVDHVVLVISDENGRDDHQTLDADTRSFRVSGLKEKTNTTVQAIPVPKYGEESDGSAYVDQIVLTPLVLSPQEKFMRVLPRILIGLGAALALGVIGFVVYKATRKRMTGTLGIRIEQDGALDTIAISLDKVEDGTRVEKMKQVKKHYQNRPYYPALSKLVLFATRVGEDNHIAEDTRGREYIANNPALKIVVGSDVMEFTDSNNVTCFFSVEENGIVTQFACLYSADDAFPNPAAEPSDAFSTGGFGGFSF